MVSFAAAGRPNTTGGFNTSSALMGLAAGAIGGAVLGKYTLNDQADSNKLALSYVWPNKAGVAVC